MQKKTLIFPLLIVLAIGTYFISNTKECKDPNCNCGAVSKDAVKIGYYNSMEIVKLSKIGKEFTTEAEKKRNEYQEKFRAQQAALAQKAENNRKALESGMVKPESRDKMQQELLTMQRDLEHQGRSYEENLKLFMQQGQMRLVQALTDSLKVVGAQIKANLMQDTAQMIVVAPFEGDCTQLVVKAMDSKYDADKVSKKTT